MITEAQLRIFEVFARKPFSDFTRKQIKQISKEKSNNALTLVLKKLKYEEVIFEKQVGKSGILTLNLNNDLIFYYLALANDKMVGKTVKRAVEKIKEEINKITPFYSLVIFGSYAENRQKPESDLDVAIFIEDESKRKQIRAAVNSAKLKIIPEVDTHIISKKEFIGMLTNDEENLGKQIAEKHLVLHNHQIFYEIIKEGIKHGFHV